MKPAETVRLALNDPAALSVDAAPEVRRVGLGGWVWSQLPPQHPLKAELSGQRLTFLSWHLRARAALMPLLRAWHEAGIAVLLLKGFAHAEFLYADPSQRAYGDVDVLIYEADAGRAARIAQQLGWQSDGLEHEPQQWTHEVTHLFSPGGQAKLDVHRSVTARLPLAGFKVARATRAFWQAAQSVNWQGTVIWQPDPRDQMLLLALTRAWTGDRAHLKPADILDYRALQRQYQFSDKVLDERAATLGCLHTWKAFKRTLEHGRYDQDTSAARVRQHTLLDGHLLLLGEWPRRLFQAPQITADIVRVIPHALNVRRDLARGGDMRTLAVQQALGQICLKPHETALRITRGTRWALKLVYPQGATCVPRSLTLYRALTAAGLPVSFISGVRREGTQVEGHAWVEFPEPLNQTFGEPQSARQFEEIYRHSAQRS